MTDNEIIKALEKCTGLQTSTSCSGCKYTVGETGFAFGRYCKDALLVDVLNLINRQKAEIERLSIELQAMRGAANSYKAENEKLLNHYFIDTKMGEGTPKQKAIKEFAEKLKKEIQDKKYKYVTETNYSKTCNAVIDSCVVCIDNLVKEMVGKSDEKL